MLLEFPVSAVFGFRPPVVNGGSVKNKGLETALGYHASVKDFFFDITANASFIKNEVTDLEGIGPIIGGFGYTFDQIGYPINSFYGLVAEGIFQNQSEVDKHAQQSGGVIGAGDIKYKDLNNDGVIDDDDRTYLGSSFPKVTYGLNLAARWKGFDLSAFWQGAAGVKGFLRGEVMGILGTKIGKPTSIFLDHWTPENPTADFPRLWITYTQNDPTNNPSSFWMRNASYLRLKNLQIGYSLTGKWLNKAGIQKARIYYSGQNILTFSKFYDWVDPEAPAGERGFTYPQVRINTIGVNFTF